MESGFPPWGVLGVGHYIYSGLTGVGGTIHFGLLGGGEEGEGTIESGSPGGRRHCGNWFAEGGYISKEFSDFQTCLGLAYGQPSNSLTTLGLPYGYSIFKGYVGLNIFHKCISGRGVEAHQN